MVLQNIKWLMAVMQSVPGIGFTYLDTKVLYVLGKSHTSVNERAYTKKVASKMAKKAFDSKSLASTVEANVRA